jgi:hypothetical protein
MSIKNLGKNILDSKPYKVIIKPALNISTGGFYDIVDQFANVIFSNRKNEFIKFLDDNYDLFQDKEILKNEHFISGLLILYQEIIKQRFEWKRQRMYGIFLGFANEKDKENFELERIYNTLNLMSQNEFSACFEISKCVDLQSVMTGQFIHLEQRLGLNEISDKRLEWIEQIMNPEETIWGLIRLNIFIHTNTGESNNYVLSKFGKQFINSLSV